MPHDDHISAGKGFTYGSSKTYVHSAGLSCCFRQWRAEDTHCRFLHGYSLQVKVDFEAFTLDGRNWVMNFGGLKEFKRFLEETFDHKTIIAEDDPMLPFFREMANGVSCRQLYRAQTNEAKLIQLVVLPHVGCESFARYIFEWLDEWIKSTPSCDHVMVKKVTINEHDGNGAWYGRVEYDYNRVLELARSEAARVSGHRID
jgi:6-pyruvoyltetrahydropterin/6-carboxytetrahydropterin synthase